jgi:NADH-quinone oxidoreductase subunit L
MKGAYNLVWNKYFIDEVYYGLIVNPLHKVAEVVFWKGAETYGIDNVVNRSGSVVTALSELFRRMQSGIVQNYALLMIVGIVAVMAWLLLA